MSLKDGEVRVAPETEAARRAQRGLALRLGLAAALAALLGVLVDLTRPPSDPALARRSWSSPRADGLRGLVDLASRLGLKVDRQRASWGQLPDPAGHALLVVAPRPGRALQLEGAALDGTQVRALGRWVEAGGRLLVTLPGRDRLPLVGIPLLELDGGRSLVGELLGYEPVVSSVALTAPLVAEPPLGVELTPLRPLPRERELLGAAWFTWNGRGLVLGEARTGVAELPTFNPLREGDLAPRLRLGERTLGLEGPRGAGRLWVLASAYPLTNLGLAQGGTARLAAGLLDDLTDGGRRTLLLDERSHGLGGRKGLLGPLQALALGPPAAGLLLLLALAAWRGGVAEGPPRAPPTTARRAKEEFVVALAGLWRRAGKHDAAARTLVEAWRERVGGHEAAGELEALARRAAGPLDERGLAEVAQGLRAAAAKAEDGRRRREGAPRSARGPGDAPSTGDGSRPRGDPGAPTAPPERQGERRG